MSTKIQSGIWFSFMFVLCVNWLSVDVVHARQIIDNDLNAKSQPIDDIRDDTWTVLQVGNAQKLDNLLQVISHHFSSTVDKLEKLSRSIERVDERIDTISALLNEQIHNQDGGQSLLLQKMLVVSQQTYQICKDALVCRSRSNGGGFVFHGTSSQDSTSSKSRKQSDPTLLVDSGRSKNGEELDPSSSNEVDVNMYQVLDTVSNYTINKFASRLQRNIAEELNVHQFKVIETLKLNSRSAQDSVHDRKSILNNTDLIVQSLIEFNEKLQNNEELMDKILQSLVHSHHDNSNDDEGGIKGCNQSSLTTEPTTKQLENIETKFDKFLEKVINLFSSNATQNQQQNNAKKNANHVHIDNGHKINSAESSIHFVTLNASNIMEEGEKHKNKKQQTDVNSSQLDNNRNGGRYPPQYYEYTTDPYRPKFKPASILSSKQSNCTKHSTHSYPRSCLELHTNGATCDGVYVILLNYAVMKHVYCDMNHNGGGWTVILRRGKFANSKYEINFDQDYTHYKSGFGDMHMNEFWLGLDIVHQLTSKEKHYLEIDVEDVDGNYLSLVFNGFQLGSMDGGYMFMITDIEKNMIRTNDNITTALNVAYSLLKHNRTKFATTESTPRYRYGIHGKSCAQTFRSGWWYVSEVNKPQLCTTTNQFQLMAPQSSKLSKIISSNRHHNDIGMRLTQWLEPDQRTPRTLRYAMMKIKSLSPSSRLSTIF